MNRQSRFNERYWAGALGWLRGMVWGGWREEGSGWGTRVFLWRIHVDIWQNQYNIVKLKNKKKRKSVVNIHWKGWSRSWSSNTLATWCEELTHWKRPWCWDRLKAAGEGDDRGWDVWMASPVRWTWVWTSSGSWWWTGMLGVLQCMGLQSQTWLGSWT